MRLRLGLAAGLAATLVGAVTVQNTLLAASPPTRAATTSFAWVPASLQGLRVQRENITSTLESDRRALWVDQVALYTLRHGRELQGTLQVARFKPSAPWQSSSFDESLADQVGTQQPVVARLGGIPVYITVTRGLGLATWFRDGWMLILGIRTSYTSPKQLIRDALELKP
jgi:hypothetical protein